MQQARVGLYRVKPGVADEIIRRAEADLATIYRNQPGFVAYGIIKTGDDALISLTIWNTPDQAEVAMQAAAAWQKQYVGHMVDSEENHAGDLAFFWVLSAIGR
jgi:heme-degrading monooxygenase HmoA